jgi:serine protease Do
MPALVALLLTAQVHAVQPSLASKIPRMTAPVVNVRALEQHASSLPLIGHYLPHLARQSVGSGVVVDKRGLILTNNHIIEGATLVQVSLSDDGERPREYLAKVIGRDKQLDLALLEVAADRPLPTVRLGDSSRLRVGDYVVAIGNPYGLAHTVTRGILSARGRALGESGPEAPLLQTDASINPGSSGGPLYDLDGRLVGINTAIVEGAHGIGFALPVDFVRRAIPQLEHQGRIVRGSAGVALSRVPAELAEAEGLRHPGAFVESVAPGGPAEEAGVQPGDVILRWDGEPVESSDSLPWLIALTPPGSRVHVQLLREGSEERVDVRLGAAP